MIRIVPTSDLGLDVLLGGGWRLVTRLPEKTSATVLVRGGAGSGKTLMGLQVALDLAKALGGDVAVGCVEILPTEYIAQILSARPDIEEKRIVQLPRDTAQEVQEPRILCGLLLDLDPHEPDLVKSLETLQRQVREKGGNPVVFIVDSLIEGYGIGSSTNRLSADAVMKFAVASGNCLVLCEESKDETQSPWVFAVDTVLSLGIESRERGRWIEVKKHRFGPTTSGKHELDIRSGEKPAVYPEPHAWLTKHVPSVLESWGWKLTTGEGVPALGWDYKSLGATQVGVVSFGGSFVLVSGSLENIVRSLSLALLPINSELEQDLIFEFEPTLFQSEIQSASNLVVCYFPTLQGVARVLKEMMMQLTTMFVEGRPPRRILIGDLKVVLGQPWDHAVRVFAGVLKNCNWNLPVIACEVVDSGRRSSLVSQVDLLVEVAGGSDTLTSATVSVGWPHRQPHYFQWPKPFQFGLLPGYKALLQRRKVQG